ncbi:MAG: hypothetical protein PHC61_00535 [Chitinivibrionales bacterium]|nr:hypothetical protein [Chitinivibrionales bacterium]
MLKYTFFGLSVLAALFCGCYTQFGTLDDTIPRTPGDSVAAINAASNPSPVYENPEHERCYWTTDWLGQPELRCYTSYYSDDWDSFYNHPWWYGPQGFGGHCRNCGNNYPGSYNYSRYSHPSELQPRADTMTQIRRARGGVYPELHPMLSGGGSAPASGGAAAAKATAASSSPSPANVQVRRARTPDFAPAPSSPPPQDAPLPKAAESPAPQAPEAAPPAPVYSPASQDTGSAPAPVQIRRSPRSR